MNLYTVWVLCTVYMYTPLKVKNKLIVVSASDRLMINFPSIFYYNYTKGVIFYANARFIERKKQINYLIHKLHSTIKWLFLLIYYVLQFDSVCSLLFARLCKKKTTTTNQFWWTGIRILVIIRNFPRNKSREFSRPKHQCNCH